MPALEDVSQWMGIISRVLLWLCLVIVIARLVVEMPVSVLPAMIHTISVDLLACPVWEIVLFAPTGQLVILVIQDIQQILRVYAYLRDTTAVR